jgi:hypothetical protein
VEIYNVEDYFSYLIEINQMIKYHILRTIEVLKKNVTGPIVSIRIEIFDFIKLS